MFTLSMDKCAVYECMLHYQNIRILLLSLVTTYLVTYADEITIYHENNLSCNLLSPAKLCKRNV